MAAPFIMLLTGCAATSSDKGGPTTAELDVMAESAVATLLETAPDVQELIDHSAGYAVLTMKTTKIPVFGTGVGYGLVVDRQNGHRSYIRITRFEMGGGLGVEKYKVIIIFSDPDLLARAAKGAWYFDAGAQAQATAESTVSPGPVTRTGKGYQSFRLMDSGAIVAITVRLARAKPYR